MDVIYILLPLSLFIALLGLGAYIWSVWSGQFEDLESPAVRAILDEEPEAKEAPADRS